MENLNDILNDLTGKDELKASKAASYLIENSDIELFNMLVQKTDFLFDFVRSNVYSRLENAVNNDNFMNILKFFEVYSQYYDDFFASVLSKHANENLTDIIFELLEKGTVSQKTYAAKYFFYIPDTVALEALSKLAFSDDDALSFNSAEALGQMQDEVSFDIALSYLKSDDEFDKLKAVKFFNAYGRDFPFNDIFTAMKNSKMPENIAGQIPYMQSLIELFNIDNYKYDTLLALDFIISGLGEILPLSDIFQFELFEFLQILIKINNSENIYCGIIASILLKSLSKFKLFTENQEYIFDEDKDTKYEIGSILKLLKGQNADFWNLQKHFIINALDTNYLSVISVIMEFSIKEAVPKLKDILTKEDNEIILCETLSALKSLNALETSDIQNIQNKIKNPNIKAIIDSL